MFRSTTFKKQVNHPNPQEPLKFQDIPPQVGGTHNLGYPHGHNRTAPLHPDCRKAVAVSYQITSSLQEQDKLGRLNLLDPLHFPLHLDPHKLLNSHKFLAYHFLLGFHKFLDCHRHQAARLQPVRLLLKPHKFQDYPKVSH